MSAIKDKRYQEQRIAKIAQATKHLLEKHNINEEATRNELQHTKDLVDEALESLGNDGLTAASRKPIALLLHQQRLLRQHFGIGGFTSDIPF